LVHHRRASGFGVEHHKAAIREVTAAAEGRSVPFPARRAQFLAEMNDLDGLAIRRKKLNPGGGRLARAGLTETQSSQLAFARRHAPQNFHGH
jgi:hypothetical protein